MAVQTWEWQFLQTDWLPCLFRFLVKHISGEMQSVKLHMYFGVLEGSSFTRQNACRCNWNRDVMKYHLILKICHSATVWYLNLTSSLRRDSQLLRTIVFLDVARLTFHVGMNIVRRFHPQSISVKTLRNVYKEFDSHVWFHALVSSQVCRSRYLYRHQQWFGCNGGCWLV